MWLDLLFFTEKSQFENGFHIDNSEHRAKMLANAGKGEWTMDRRRQWIAALICAVMLLSMLVSSAYIAHEAAHHHECTGEDCPVCRFIAQVEQVRRGFGTALSALLLICLALALRREMRAPATAEVPALCTTVGRKVRLND